MGMLSNLGNSLKKSLGLKGPSGEELRAMSEAEAAAERSRLKVERRHARLESGFLETEGMGKRRQARISFGNKERITSLTPQQRSLRESGRFDSNRLVL